MVRLAVDLMGGDDAPKVTTEGLLLFHQRCPKTTFLLYGTSEVGTMLGELYKKHPLLKECCEFILTEEVVSSDLKPSEALRSLPRSSMRLALKAVSSGQAQGAVSAGNTGAYLALSKTILKTVGGIDRPAITSQIPTEKGESVMLDLGGTISTSSRNLVEYAIMGDCFARHVLGEKNPSIGLLNVGKEDIKGNDTLQQAFSILNTLPMNFRGFIEGHDIARGSVSVIVTDGFTGNAALKTAEGVVHMCTQAVKQCFENGGIKGKIAGWLSRPFLSQLKVRFDPRIYNGALWLGLNGVAVKSHGGTDAFGFAYALEMAHDMVHCGIVKAIETSVGQCLAQAG